MPGDPVTSSTCIAITPVRPLVAPPTGQGITPIAELPTTSTNTAPATTQPLRKGAREISPAEHDSLEGTHILRIILNKQTFPASRNAVKRSRGKTWCPRQMYTSSFRVSILMVRNLVHRWNTFWTQIKSARFRVVFPWAAL